MMPCCAICGLPPRQDDAMKTEFIAGKGMVTVCTPCLTSSQGGMLSDPKKYPIGQSVPRRQGSDGDIGICAYCRIALREGESATALRLFHEDTNDAKWESYSQSMLPVSSQHQIMVREIEQKYQTPEADHCRDQAISVATQELNQRLVVLMERCDNEESYLREEIILRQQHADAVNEAEELHRVETAAARSAHQSALSQANFLYRKEAVKCWESLWNGDGAGRETNLGALLCCSDCTAKYRPRILERLIRKGIASASVTEDVMDMNMLL